MAFDDVLPRNSESRCISVALRMIKKQAPQIKWVISFADGCSCGDGAIYRASGFVLTGIKENANIAVMPDGTKLHKMTLESSPLRPIRALGGKSYFDITGGVAHGESSSMRSAAIYSPAISFGTSGLSTLHMRSA